MLEHNAKKFYFTCHQLEWLRRDVKIAIERRSSSSLPTKSEADRTRRVLKRIESEAERLGFSRVIESLYNIDTDDELLQPMGGSPAFTLDLLRRELEVVNREIARALGLNKFMMIPSTEAEYYNNHKLFGHEVATRFPKANKEIIEAGNCFATGSYTATVFHLMRAVEYGVRALITVFKIKFKKRPKDAVELRQWGEILAAIYNKISEVEKQKKTRLRDEKLEFLRDVAAQFKYFKDKWRNHVMHTRDSYEVNDVRKTMQYVGEFMKHIATKIAEK